MNAEGNFLAVLDRLKSRMGANSDGQMANKLGLSASAYANLKARGSIPYEKIINFAISQRVNIHWLFTNETCPPSDLPEPERQPADQRIQAIAEQLSTLSERQIRQIECRLEELQTLNHLMAQVSALKSKINPD